MHIAGGALVFALLIAGGTLAGCATVPIDETAKGDLRGRVVVEWRRQDTFVYLPGEKGEGLRFKPSFMTEFIEPGLMYTDGGSIPRIFHSIPGLSPWGLGPAYIVHDWIFKVRQCGWDAPAAVKAIDFKKSAQVLAEIGAELIRAGLIDDNMLPQVICAVRSRFAENIWERPGTKEECTIPGELTPFQRRAAGAVTVVDFEIPPPAR